MIIIRKTNPGKWIWFQLLFVTEFRECFYLFARTGHIKTIDELTKIMRSLGLSPTISELTGYLKQKVIFTSQVAIEINNLKKFAICQEYPMNFSYYFFRPTKWLLLIS